MTITTILFRLAVILLFLVVAFTLMTKTLTLPLFLYLMITAHVPSWVAAHHTQHIIAIVILGAIPVLYWGGRLLLWWLERRAAMQQFMGDVRMKIFEMEHAAAEPMPEPGTPEFDDYWQDR